MNTHLELWAEWSEWITMGIYDDEHSLAQREAELQQQGYTTRRMQY